MNRKKVFEIFVLTLVFLHLFLTHRAFALVQQMSVEELTFKSSKIITGTVTDVRSQWETENGRNLIFTYVILQVETDIKGTGPKIITIKVPGGQVGDIAQWVSDTPQFVSGEKVLLFLQGEPFEVVGGYQGKFIIQDNKVLGPNVTIYDLIYQIRKIIQQSSSESFMQQEGETDLTHPIPASMKLDYEKYSRELRDRGGQFEGRELANQQRVEHEGLQTSWNTIMTEGFEGEFPSGLWDVTGDPTWGADDFKPHSGSMSAWCASGGPSGLDPETNDYPNNMDGMMIYGPFDLSDATDAELLFYYSPQITSGDRFYYYASKDGWNFAGYYVFGGNGAWGSTNFDLSSVPYLGNLCGEPEVWIMFRFSSNSSVTSKGVFIDDIILQKYLPTGPPPSISNITPIKASAGTGTTVAIHGANFGATEDSSKVEFFYRTGQPKISADVVSWSDTEIVCEVPTALVYGYPASASSGPITVRTMNGTSNDYTFRVSFGYGGVRWPGSNPRIDYYINENTSDCTGEGAAVVAATQEWDNTDSRFTFRYAGTTSASGPSRNGVNEIMWGQNSAIAVTTYWYRTTDNAILECDIVFNDDLDWGNGASISYYDVQTIATHELGHWLNLRDLYGDVDDDNDSAKTMYGFGSKDLVKRRLHSDDISGILWIYGEKSMATPWIPLLLLED